MGPGSVEVEAFFIISGFYMAMILERKYAGRVRDFYENRYLRIFPSYLVVVVFSLLAAAIFGAHGRFGLPFDEMASLFMSADVFAKFYFLAANLGILAIDASLFLSFDGIHLQFAEDFRQSAIPVYKMLLVPQGWSLGCELYFYALAPFLLSSRLRLAAAFAASAGVFAAFQGSSLPADPWAHRFFPSILFMFLSGSIAWRIFGARLDDQHVQMAGRFLLPVVLAAIFGLDISTFDPTLERLIILTLTAISVGPVFAFTKQSKIDNLIGEHSYPIYLAHLLALNVATLAVPVGHASYIALGLTLALSAALVYLVERPVEKFRQARLRNNPDRGRRPVIRLSGDGSDQ